MHGRQPVPGAYLYTAPGSLLLFPSLVCRLAEAASRAGEHAATGDAGEHQAD